MAKSATIRTRSAGRLVEQVRYTHVKKEDSEKVRGEKKKRTTAVMAKYNKKTSEQKMELQLAANFVKGDNVCCVTYDDEHLPKTRAQAVRRFAYFMAKLRKLYEAEGVDIVIGWSHEHKHGEGRWHHHFICTATGEDYEKIRSCWPYGSIVEFKPLRVDEEKNYATIAHYFSKEAREKPGLRSWSFSRNAKKPETDRQQVEADEYIEIPEGVTVLNNESDETVYGRYQYVKYILPEAPTDRKVHAKRRVKAKEK